MKAYRKLSLVLHPDKNKEENAIEKFRELTRASDILLDPEQRKLFDYYLAHPREYYKVSGQYYYHQLPKADIRVILFGEFASVLPTLISSLYSNRFNVLLLGNFLPQINRDYIVLVDTVTCGAVPALRIGCQIFNTCYIQ